MGNDASRPLGDGLTPRAMSPGVPPSPRTPSGRRRSFSATPEVSNPAVERTIQRMDKTIRKRVRGGITYNMKIILRGDRGTGKTSLFQRLKGAPIPEAHEPTPQLQSATINWSFRANSEESVKCDVWDVVDKGFHPGTANSGETDATSDAEVNPFGMGAAPQSGANMVATVDATTVDVYQETHGVVFLLDVTKPHTLEYVRQQLDQVPVHIPTLVLGNFRDKGNQRKIFKEDIQELLYGGSASHHQPVRRPHELLYFECSLLNCYGLKALHQYFGIPFLQLKQHTIRQQLRILEGEFAHLKHDLQAKIAEQRYADYLEHIRATGSDIRTGRRVAGAANAAGSQPSPGEATVAAGAATEVTVNEDEDSSESAVKTRLDRTHSSSSDVMVARSDPDPEKSIQETVSPTSLHLELGDLPERETALAHTGSALKIDYTEEERLAAKKLRQQHAQLQASKASQHPEAKSLSPQAASARVEAEKSTTVVKVSSPQKQKARKNSVGEPDAVMNLEDFQVPKHRYNDLDDFYSDEDSEDEAGDDDDVVVAPAGARLGKAASSKYHKQQFLDSDDSESDNEELTRQLKKLSPRRQKTKSTTEHNMEPMPSLPHPPGSSTSPATTTSPRAPLTPPPGSSSPLHSPHRRVKEPTMTTEELSSSDVAGPVNVQTESPRHESIGDGSDMDNPAVEDEGVVSEQHSIHEIEEMPSEPDEPIQAVDDNAEPMNSDLTAEEETVEEEPPQQYLEESVQHAVPVDTSISPTDLPAGHHDEDTLDELLKSHVPLSPKRSDMKPPVEDQTSAQDASCDGSEVGSVSGDAKSQPNAEHGYSTTESGANNEVSIDAAQIDAMTPSDEDATEEARVVDSKHDDEATLSGQGNTKYANQHVPSTELELSDYDSDAAEEKPHAIASQPARSHRDEIIMSDDDVGDGDVLLPPTQLTQHPPSNTKLAPDDVLLMSPPIAPATTTNSMLDDFLNDSGSDSDSAAQGWMAKTNTSEKKESDSDDDDEDDARFAAYDARKTSHRRSKSQRKQQRDEILMFNSTIELHASTNSSRTSSFATTDVTTNSQTTSFVSQDVLAAIRMAEQDAMKMLEAVAPSQPHVAPCPQPDDLKKKKKKKASTVSSRRKAGRQNEDETGGETKKKSKKKKESDSSRTKRREIILTDEDEP